MEILNVQGLCKTYGSGAAQVRALQNATFSLQRGEFAAIVGDSGSGKSTLLSCVGGLDTPTSGKVFLDGEDLFALPEERRTIFRRQNIGFIFQAFHLIPELNVEQNMVFPLLLDGQRPEQAGWMNCWKCSVWRTAACICRANSPADSSSGQRLGGRLSHIRQSYLRMSRPAILTPKAAGMLWNCFCGLRGAISRRY